MVNQILIAGDMIGVCEALLYAHKAGLDLETVLAIGRRRGRGELAARTISGPQIIAGNFEPGFYVEHFIKDMGIALAEAEKMNLACRGWRWRSSSTRRCRRRGMGARGRRR